MPAHEFDHATHVDSSAHRGGHHARIAFRQRLLKEQGPLDIAMRGVRCAEGERRQMRAW